MVPLARTLLDQVLTLPLTLTLTLTLMDEVPSNLYAEMHCCVSCGCEGRPNLLLQQISNPQPNPNPNSNPDLTPALPRVRCRNLRRNLPSSPVQSCPVTLTPALPRVRHCQGRIWGGLG